MVDLSQFDPGLDALEKMLERMTPHFPEAESHLETLRNFRSVISDGSLAPLTDKELLEVERAVGLLSALDGPSNRYASEALAKIKAIIESGELVPAAS